MRIQNDITFEVITKSSKRFGARRRLDERRCGWLVHGCGIGVLASVVVSSFGITGLLSSDGSDNSGGIDG